MTLRFLSATLVAGVLATQTFAAELASPEGRVLLTIGGDIAVSNTEASKPDVVNFANFMEVEYDKAVAFDDAMLSGLEQHDISATILRNTQPVLYSGPLLSDVLTKAGAEGKTAVPMAMDGYAAEIPWDLIEAHQPILATHADGKPLEIGKLGPAMIVFPVLDDAELYDSLHAKEVFATFYIGIE